jgi:uncharacterized pyridoxal phosphate-containing UPF0001 family protein
MKLETLIKKRDDLDKKIKAAQEAERRKAALASLLASSKLIDHYTVEELEKIFADLVAKRVKGNPTPAGE